MDPQILAALDAHSTLTLAYADADGPQACAVFYAPYSAPDAEGPVLYFVTSPATRHGRALLAGDGRVAFTAQRDDQEWAGITGLQGRGHCRVLRDAERAAAWAAYRARFPYVDESERLRRAVQGTELWELRPDWLRLVDNGRGFGHKTEWRPAG
ncbi:pyridoxamine 5'-phosphate oxidase [Streptomyces sp. NPDC052396]|uniref:pyridoxamine 5'-phosphate oxidase family protein n=1 Tax=Streptomyces sp. NPDC052396 TaxID=3365689 RepID=UPI0037D2EBFD